MSGTGWKIFVTELSVSMRVGIHDVEYLSPQVVLIDGVIDYDGMPDEVSVIDYDVWCSTIQTRLENSLHIRLLEDVLVQVASLIFERWPDVARLTVSAHKPKIRSGVRKGAGNGSHLFAIGHCGRYWVAAEPNMGRIVGTRLSATAGVLPGGSPRPMVAVGCLPPVMASRAFRRLLSR